MTPHNSEEEHIFTSMVGGTGVKCSCGKSYATTSEANQHWNWEFQKAKDCSNKALVKEIISKLPERQNLYQKEREDGNWDWRVQREEGRNEALTEFKQLLEDYL